MDKYGQWISVKDRLPNKSGSYLVVPAKGGIDILRYSSKYKLFNALDFGTQKDAEFTQLKCTYWMPLPEPPEEESKPCT